ncbi:MAG: HYR domain-containing protein, partial [Saprospiraceae bacterium]|nr:HYR domain-containing protein [Saprospiraceae bacterium]
MQTLLRSILSFLILTLLTHPSDAQTSFIKTFGGAGLELGYKVLPLADGFLLAGVTETSGAGQLDGLLIRTDLNGTVLWQRSLGDAANDEITSIAAANDGGFVVFGQRQDPFPSTDTNLFFIKVDDAGQVQWGVFTGYLFQKEVATSAPGAGQIIKLDDGYIITGTASGAPYIQRVNNSGILVWGKRYASAAFLNLESSFVSGDTLYASGQYASGGVQAKIDIQTGNTFSMQAIGIPGNLPWLDAGFGDEIILSGYQNANPGGLLEHREWLVKGRRNGSVGWSKAYWRPGINWEGGAIDTDDGGFLFAPHGPTTEETSGANLVKVDADGALQWGYAYGSDSSALLQVVPTPDGGFVAIGYTWAGGQTDILLLKTDANGWLGPCCQRLLTDIHTATVLTPLEPKSVGLTSYQVMGFWTPETPVASVSEQTLSCPNAITQVGQTLEFCAGDTLLLNGQPYTESGTVVIQIQSPSGCDTVVTYHLLRLPAPSRSETLSLPPGGSVTIQGQSYSQPGTVVLQVPGVSGACDSIITYVIKLDPVVPDTCTNSLNFVKYLGEASAEEWGYALCKARDGNLYLAGSKNFPDALLAKVTPSGTVLWSRQFQLDSLARFHIAELIEDSDGMLLGCGNLGEGDINKTAAVFKYDPVAQVMLWVKTFSNQSPEAYGILELEPGGNYLLNLSPQLAPALTDAELWTLERQSGDLVGGLTKRYSFGSADNFTALQIRDGFLYTAGRFSTHGNAGPSGTANMRHTLSKINLANGQPVWARMSHADTSSQAFLYGMDLILDQDHLVSICRGYVSDSPSATQRMFLQKNSLDGDLLWTKQYSLPNGRPEEIVRVPGGYLIFGTYLQNGVSMLFLLQTDTLGTPVWARQVPNTLEVYTTQFDSQQGEVVVVGDSVFLLTTSQFPSDLVLLKWVANGMPDDSCGAFLPLDVQVFEVPNPVNTAIPIQFLEQQGQLEPLAVATQASALPEKTYCVRCVPACAPVVEALEVSFCPGDSVRIAGTAYYQAGVVVDTIPGNPCDTIRTYTLALLPQPLRTVVIDLCPGDSVTLGGSTYTQADTVLLAHPGKTGCDTLVTYLLQPVPLPQPSTISLSCPLNQVFTIPAIATNALISYDLPVAATDCPCGDVQPDLIQGLASGAFFSLGTTQVCYRTTDACGSSMSCCFTVTLQHPDEDEPCDVKTTSCVRYEIMGIDQHPSKQKTYRIRVTNLCSSLLQYVAFQLPDGLVADAPTSNTVFTSANGRAYEVRNPNYTPFYSIRFKTLGNGLAAGESDLFEYTLPPQADPVFIHATARLASQVFYE